ncbi:putative receptor-like protein kinase At5g39000 isoform X2 [Salvia miltiorrhiza]|uniref:putative receptor-like protein kinase At5g39000 isoform X2 n=1 Tax=Salvia miltiorrhiza TaxID=226208 RepID=UPI0025ABEFE5|nr:putative receptor-like protein kinase At5g39000 isoform X2 [Salvia miltiorrhiza]
MLHNHMIIVFLVISIGRLGAAVDPNCISINRDGGAAPATGKWHRDAAPKGSSTTSTVKGDLITAVDPVPARISSSQFSFSFQPSPGRDTSEVDVYVDNSTSLERVHYQHIKWGPVSAGDDIASMFGMWAEPTIKENAEMATNKTWRVSVDVGFKYVVRLHLCEAGLEMDFVLLINNMIFLTSADMLQQRENRNFLWYNNYVVMVEGLKQEGNRDISISLHSHHEFLDRHGPLEGFEVFKLSNHDGNLASPSLVIPVQDSPSQTLLHSLRALLYNPYGPMSLLSYTILLHMCTILVVVYLESNAFGLMSLLPNTKEDNKPSSMAKRLAEILGICEYGGVDRGFVDYGREILAIKPLKIDFKQGEHEFRTVIETLWGLQHVNLLSLIGCCWKHQEMVLVDEYIPTTKMADRLYKPPRKSNDVCLQSWKQRLQICIEVSQALEYLHSGPMIVHRDLKASNILLDENFVAKLADFGLAETRSFRNSQSQDSTDLIGTCGYIAPDFFTTGELTKGSDVYSFGMVLLETLCGRAAMKPRSEEDNRKDNNRSQKENMNLVSPNVKINADNYVSRMESTGSQQQEMPPGFRFHPSDLELMAYYLKKKITSTPLHIDLDNCEPWDLPETAATFREPAWYFFSLRDRKHLNSTRANSRYWKTRGMHKHVMNSSESMQGFQEWQISDFGLAKNGPTQVMATYGYAAPEYIATEHLGNVSRLKKLVTRMRAFDTIRPSGHYYVGDWKHIDVRIEEDAMPFCGVYDLGDWTKPHLKHIYPTKSALDIALICLESEASMQETQERISSSSETMMIRQSFDLCSAVSRGSQPILFVC